MEVFLFRPDFYEKHYNCNTYSIDSVPLESRRHQWLGIGFMGLTSVFQLLYVPCLMSIWKHTTDSYCYKIMFFIGLIDMVALVVNGWITGYLGFVGAVFCSSPRFIYVSGAIGLGCWCAESSIEVILALNRCIELWSHELAIKLFGGKKLWLWLGIPSIYGIYYVLWTKPIIFNGIYFSWFFNPHQGYIEDAHNIYENIFHTVHNNVILLALVSTYVAFYAILMLKSFGRHSAETTHHHHSYSQKMIFLQVFLISATNAIAASIYVYMQYFAISETLIVIGQFCWMNAHGLPPVIYLTMNKSIKRDCRILIGALFGKTYSVHPFSGSIPVGHISIIGKKMPKQQQSQQNMEQEEAKSADMLHNEFYNRLEF